jgi:hypothetical protein
MPRSLLSRASRTLLVIVGIVASIASHAAAADLSITYRGKAVVNSASTTDQNGDSFSVSELSGITYRGGNSFTAVSDENGKLINLTVAFNSNGSIAANTVTGGISLATARDYEGIAFTGAARNSVFLSNESNSPAPALHEISLAAPYSVLQTVDVPAVFAEQGDNRGLESLTRRADGLEMWTANEEALSVDGPASTAAAGTVVRLQRFAVSGNSVTPAQQYAYLTNPIHGGIGSADRSGLSDLVVLPDGTLLALERSARAGLPLFESRIYQVGFTGATDTSQGALANGLSGQAYTPVSKTLLVSTTAIGENLEGLCLGPQLPNGNFVLLGVVDNGDGLSANTLVAFELVTVVPEPHAWMLAVGGGIGLLVLFIARQAWKRRRRPIVSV